MTDLPNITLFETMFMEVLATPKKYLLRWCGWFFLGNAILFCLIGLHYLSAVLPSALSLLTLYGKKVMSLFLVLAYLGQLSFLAFIPYIFIAPCILFFPACRFIFLLAIVIAGFAASLLIIDTFIFVLYRFHLNGILFSFIMTARNEQVLDFSWHETLFTALVILGVFFVEWVLALVLWHQVILKNKFLGVGKSITLFLSVCLYSSLLMILFSLNHPMNRMLISASRFLPFYENMLGLMLPGKEGLVAIERMGETHFLQPQQASQPLRYPLEVMQSGVVKHPLNLVIIVIDTWRADMLNADVAPFISQFAKKSWVFQQHYSGGNSTGPGIFTLFYGIPSLYWSSMQAQHQGPVLIDALLQNQYQMGIFSSETLREPPMNETVFRAVKNLRLETPGNTPYERDRSITREFDDFIGQAAMTGKPFFSFLLYNSVHSYCAFDEDLKPLQPAVTVCNRMQLNDSTDPVPYLNRYKNAILLIDKQVEHVIETLAAKNLLENTVVMVTADHGEEFNDNHLGYWGHASNFTHYQVQTPMIVYWPGSKPAVFTHETSHYDVAPTLMRRLLGDRTPFAKYSIGKDLLDVNSSPYLIVGSYIDFGIVERDRITTIFPVGNFEIDHLDGRPIVDAKLDLPVVKDVFLEMRKYYKS